MATWVVLLKKEITALSCMYCFHNLGNSKQPKYLDIHTFRPCLGNPLSRVLKMIEGDCGGFWLVEDLIPFNPFNRHKPNKALSFFLIVCHFFFSVEATCTPRIKDVFQLLSSSMMVFQMILAVQVSRKWYPFNNYIRLLASIWTLCPRLGQLKQTYYDGVLK